MYPDVRYRYPDVRYRLGRHFRKNDTTRVMISYTMSNIDIGHLTRYPTSRNLYNIWVTISDVRVPIFDVRVRQSKLNTLTVYMVKLSLELHICHNSNKRDSQTELTRNKNDNEVVVEETGKVYKVVNTINRSVRTFFFIAYTYRYIL